MQEDLIQIDYEEPITHKENITTFEALFSICSDTSKYSLTKQETIEWWNLRKEVIPLYNENDPNCEKRFRGLWYLLTETDLQTENLKNDQWKIYGFQQSNPITDLRGGGVQALDDIINYVTKQKDIVNMMCDPKNDYFFAASSINVTFFMKKYFHFQEDLNYQKDKQVFCSRRALKNFCHLLVVEDNTWTNIHEILLTDLFVNCWLGLRKERPDVTILDYGIALQRMQDKCIRTFQQEVIHSFNQLKMIYSNN